MEQIIHLNEKKVELKVIVDQRLLDDIVKCLHWIDGFNQSSNPKCDFGFELSMFYRSQLNPTNNQPIEVLEKGETNE